MFEFVILIIAIGVLAVIGVLGSRFVAADDARVRVRDRNDLSDGWLPGARDTALLAQAARELRASH
jgi:hypothetical protein